MNTRLARLIAKIDELPSESVMLDCYNQAVVKDVAITITTRINDCNHYFLLEMLPKEPFMYRVPYGKTRPGGIVPNHIAGTLTTSNHESNELVIEPIMKQPTDRVIQILNTVPDEELKSWDNPQRGRTFSPEGISPCLTLATEGNIKIMELGNIYPSGGQGGKVVDPDGLAPTICECHGEVTRIVERYRIRKLHPIETYRLQDVDEESIDKLINTKDENGKTALSKSAHYNLSGDSITVNCLYLIFDSLFYGDNTNLQPTLF